VLSRSASGYTCLHLGAFTVAREDLEQGLALFDSADRLFYAEVLAYDQLVALLAHSAASLASLGHLDQAVLRADAALAEARRLFHPTTLALALVFAWKIGHAIRSEPRLLLRYADECLAISTEHGLGSYRGFALTQRGWSLAALGHADEGITLLSGGMAGRLDSGWMAGRPAVLTRLADACRMAGQLQAALAHLAEAKRLQDETEDRWYQTETLQLLGDVLLAIGDAAAAEASYGEALALARQQSAKLFELSASMSLARLWCDQGKRSEAQELLAPIYGWFTEGFGTPVLKEAKALLEELI